MTETALKNLYKTACAGKGFEPTTGQFRVWKDTLGWCEEQDLAQAITDWFSEHTAFPMPAELKPLAANARRMREARSSARKHLVIFRCPLCHATSTGWLEVGDYRGRICNSPYTWDSQGRRIGRSQEQGRCPADMEIVVDERPRVAA